MFKQVKSALIWYYLFKFKKRISFICFLLLTAFFSGLIYDDVVRYLELKDKLEYLELALILKWVIILFNISFSIYLLLTLFKKDEKDSIANKQIETKKQVKNKTILNEREQKFLHKKKLNTKADMLLKR